MRNVLVTIEDQIRGPNLVEMCEHKGIGHPDTIADGICEAVARDLVHLYQRECGEVLHFNVDKGLLVGGRSTPRFGGGRLEVKAKMIVCGRASNPGGKLDFARLVAAAGHRWLDENLCIDDDWCDLEAEIHDGSDALRRVVGGGAARANDTSFGVGYAPLSELETKVLALADLLRSRNLDRTIPAAGRDYKVMGLRQGARTTFTIAVAIVDRHVADAKSYYEVKERLASVLASCLDPTDRIQINQLDDPHARAEEGMYLTVTGLSAEMGDDGQVGRGNRVNGLITPDRPMSLEAAAGKNPYSHVGKIYNVLAHHIAREICARIPEVAGVRVKLLSTIGRPLEQPEVAVVHLMSAESRAVRTAAAKIVDDQLNDLPALVEEIVEGRHRVY